MSLRVDPNTGDYVLTAGAFERPADTLQEEVRFRLLIKRGTWLDDPNMGSLLWTLAEEKSPQRAALKVEGYVRQALQPMTSAGRISELTVTTTVVEYGLHIHISLLDAGAEPYRFQLFQPVGAA